MSAGLRLLAYHRFGTVFNLPRGFRQASAWLCGFRVASALLPHGFLAILATPESFPICYLLDRHKLLLSSALSACFPEGFPNIRDAVRDVEASKIVCGRCGSIEDSRDVLTMTARQCWQPTEGVTKFISASKFWSWPKSWRGKFALSRRRRNARKRAFRGDKDSERNLSGIYEEVAESCRIINLHSAPCPGLVRALVDAWSLRWITTFWNTRYAPNPNI